MASPGGSDDDAAAAAVCCCMCGDHGLPHELFRCNLCRLRLQHSYCSDLYPRVPGPYRSCNWCLVKEEGSSRVKVPAADRLASRRRLNDRRDDDGDDREERPCGGGCTTRSVFSADPGKPIKKTKKKIRERAVQRPVATTTAVAKKRREPKASTGGKARFKVKVRRYKLLAEVIC